MAIAGAALETVCRKTVHHPIVFSCWRRKADRSSCSKALVSGQLPRLITARSREATLLTHVACL